MTIEYEIKAYNEIIVEIALDGRNYYEIQSYMDIPPSAEPLSALACFSGKTVVFFISIRQSFYL